MASSRLFKFPSTQQDWVLLYCRLMALFVVQGVIILLLYSQRGFNVDPDT
jgi:hypothetical protein